MANHPIKMQDEKARFNECRLQEIHLDQNTNRLKVKGRIKIYMPNSNHKRMGVAILISNTIEFKTRNITRDRNIE